MRRGWEEAWGRHVLVSVIGPDVGPDHMIPYVAAEVLGRGVWAGFWQAWVKVGLAGGRLGF